MFIFNVLIQKEFIAKELKRGLLKICFDIGMWGAHKFDVHFVRDLESLHFFQSWSATSQLSNVTGFSFQHEPSPLHPKEVWHCQNGYFWKKSKRPLTIPPPLFWNSLLHLFRKYALVYINLQCIFWIGDDPPFF